MFKLIVTKELRALFLSPKFAGTFGVCTLLILLSTYAGIREYQAAVAQYETATTLADQELREQASWMSVSMSVHRAPDPLQIFAGGVHYDVGRLSSISSWRSVKLRNSPYSDEPLFAVFRILDFVFVVQIVLTLFAILFTYDAINGEKEAGTLRLTFSNAVPRARYVAAKFAGSWLGLTLPLLIPFFFTALLLLVFRIPMEGADWLRWGLLMATSVLFFTVFIAAGLLVSAVTNRSSTSFLVLLVVWVLAVLIVPRAALMTAGQLVPVPSIGEIESQREGYSRDAMNAYGDDLGARWRERSSTMEGMAEDERQAYQDDHEWGWMQEDDALRKEMQQDIAEYGRQLEEGLRNKKGEQERVAFSLARFSPASAYQLASMRLAGTDVDLKNRYEDAMLAYREQFSTFVDQKRQESGQSDGIRISVGGGNFNLQMGDRNTLDVSEMPRFSSPRTQLSGIAPALVTDLGLLAFFVLVAFSAAFVAFLRYDLR